MPRIAIVTGASSGIGAAFARRLDADGGLDEIWLVARRADRLAALAGELTHAKGIPVALDLAATDAHERLAARLVDTGAEVVWLINNAGFGLAGAFAKLDLERQLAMIDLNVRSLTALTGAVLPHMPKGAKIIHVASAAAFKPMGGFAVYAATKSYVLAFGRALAGELAPRGITVTTVCPGPVDTEFMAVAGIPRGASPAIVTATAEDVVDTSLRDARAGHTVSVHGLPIKAYRRLAAFLPGDLVARATRFYERFQGK